MCINSVIWVRYFITSAHNKSCHSKKKQMKNIIFYLCLATVIFSCKNEPIVYNDPIPKHETFKINSSFLNEERVINIWTPPSYDSSNDSIPVLYMPDGGIKEDFPHIANTLDTLIKQNKIPNIILVGIENTERRRDLTGPTTIEYDLKYIPNPGGAENFRQFIKEELFPLVNQNYRATSKKSLIGESAAGLFVIETFMLDSNMFDNYMAMDPALWYNEQYLVKNFENLTKNNDYTNTTLWFAGSSATDIAPFTKELEQKLKNAKSALIWTYEDKPSEKHNTIFRATKEKALIWTLNNGN
jgi:predicted alpha/beta superfamily hydrolase